MGRVTALHHAFNSGVWDKDKLVRIDQEKTRLVAEQQTNFLCSVSGKMFLRPGQEYLGNTASNAEAELREFIFGATDAALLEFTNLALRVWVDDDLVTRAAVTSSVTSGDFSAATGWTDGSTTGATAAVSGGVLNLTAAGRGSLAMFKQQVTTSSAGTEHALRVVVTRGPVTFKVGSTDGGEEYVTETELDTGTHSLAFTPSGSYWVQVQSVAEAVRKVDSITVEGAGVMSLPTPWATADLSLVRLSQSADVIYVATDGYQQRKIERRSTRSWSVVKYETDDGPFMSVPSASVRLKPSVFSGNGTLTANRAFFTAANVGSLFRLFHTGQNVSAKLSGEGRFTDVIEVTGVNNSDATAPEDVYDDRAWSWTITGTWVGTLKVWRSFDGPDFGFKEYRAESSAATIDITSNDTGINTDTDDNAIVWYRIGFDEGDYTSGSAEVLLSYGGGGGTGVCRIVGYTSPTQVDMEVLTPFKNTTYTDDWAESEWSDRRTWPTAVALAEGRLWWAGFDRIWGSISDAFNSFDDEFEGDAAPISRSIATGGVNQANWIMPLQRLIFGTDGTETSARSSSFDEPLSPTNTTLKNISTVGSAPIGPVRIDNRSLFVDRSGANIFELALRIEAADYESNEMTRLGADLFSSGIRQMAVQRRPDTRVWVVLEDGAVICIVYEPGQEVMAFIPIETDGLYESVAVLPGATQDRVYFSVQRTVNSATVRFVEKMALDAEAKPATQSKVMDAFTYGTNGPASTTVAVGSHLVGETVVLWADGAPVTTTDDNGRVVRREFTVSGAGTITAPSAVTNWVCGLPYTARFKSARLAYAASMGTALLQKKKVDKLGVLLTDYVRAGLLFGPAFDDPRLPMYPLPPEREGATAAAIVIGDVHDEEPSTFAGDWSTDSRVCIEGGSPFPAAILALVMTVTTND